MKRIGLISILLGLGTLYVNSQDSIVSIPDSAFLYALIDEGLDANGDSLISYKEATYNDANPPYYYVMSLNLRRRGITDMTGIEAFFYLDNLQCSDNYLTSLDLSKNILIRDLDCSGNQLTSLDVSAIEELVSLMCDGNQLTSLDVSGKTDLSYLRCHLNQLASLDVSNTPSLIHLTCLANQLVSLDVSGSDKLEHLQCGGNQLTSLDLSNNTALTHLFCNYNKITSLDVSGSTSLTTLVCYDNQLTSLDVSGCNVLRTLSCYNNQLTSLDVSGCNSLYSLGCSDNYLTSLQVTDNTALQRIACNNNQLTNLDISNTGIGIYGNSSLALELRHMPMLIEVCVNFGFHLDSIVLDITGSPNVCFQIDCNGVCNNEEIVTIPDTAFLYALIDEGVDTNGDSLISYAEAEVLFSLDVSGVYHDYGDITDMTGIEAFVNLDTLECAFNRIKSLDVSGNKHLLYLDCRGGLCLQCPGDHYSTTLTELNISSNEALKVLDCSYTQLGSLDLSNNTSLTNLRCQNAQITSLDVSNNTDLTELDCSVNQLSSLDISNNSALIELDCSNNQLTSLAVSECKYLFEFYCFDNQLPSLDVSNNNYLAELDCSGNQLSSLRLCDNHYLRDLEIKNMVTLSNVYVWADFFDQVDIDTSGSKSLKFVYCFTTGYEKHNQSVLAIYPNPINSLLTIEAEYSDHYSINITTLNGQLIHSEEMEGITYQIDLSSYQKGVYIITIRSKDFVTTRKIIKL